MYKRLPKLIHGLLKKCLDDTFNYILQRRNSISPFSYNYLRMAINNELQRNDSTTVKNVAVDDCA